MKKTELTESNVFPFTKNVLKYPFCTLKRNPCKIVVQTEEIQAAILSKASCPFFKLVCET